MRIGRTARWILVAGLVGIALLGLWLNYNQHQEEQDALSDRLEDARARLTELRSKDTSEYEAEKARLQTDLHEAEQRAATYRTEFGLHTRSIEIEEVLFQAADEAEVTISKISCALPKKETVRDIEYDLFVLRVTAQAPEEEIVSLLTFTEKVCEAFSSDSLRSVNIEVSEDGSVLDLDLNVYFLESG